MKSKQGCIIIVVSVLCYTILSLTGCASPGDEIEHYDIAPYFFLNGDRFTAATRLDQPNYVSSLPEGDFETTRITYVNWWECSDDGTGNMDGVVYWDPSNPDVAYFYDDVWAENGTEKYQYFSCNWEEES